MDQLREETTRLVFYLRTFYNREQVCKQFAVIQKHILDFGLSDAKKEFNKLEKLKNSDYDIQFAWLVALSKMKIVPSIMDTNSMLHREYIIGMLDDLRLMKLRLKNDQKVASSFMVSLMYDYIVRKVWFTAEENTIITNTLSKVYSIIYHPSINENFDNYALTTMNLRQINQIEKITLYTFNYIILNDGEKRQKTKTILDFQNSLELGDSAVMP